MVCQFCRLKCNWPNQSNILKLITSTRIDLILISDSETITACIHTKIELSYECRTSKVFIRFNVITRIKLHIYLNFLNLYMTNTPKHTVTLPSYLYYCKNFFSSKLLFLRKTFSFTISKDKTNPPTEYFKVSQMVIIL